jgi:hypothetical protein
MHERLDYRHAPMVFAMLCTVCALPAHLQHTWWTALRHAHYPRVVAWRQKLWLYAERTAVVVPRQVPAALGTPAEMVGVIESLIEEQRLTHRDGNAVMDALLAHVTATGEWKA